MTRNTKPAEARREAPRRIAGGRRALCVSALGLVLSLALAGCSSQPKGTYLEGWWDNGDPFYAPSKTALFDENGVPTCTFPVKYNGFESRSNSINLARGVAFEIMNPETKPDAYIDPADFPTEADQAKERLRRERALNSLDVLWEYTHPLFDAENGIKSPDDLAPIKADLQEHLFGLGREGMFADYLEVSETSFQSDLGTFVVVRMGNPTTYLDAHGIPLEFDGVGYEYYLATSQEGEYLLVLDKATGDSILWMGDQQTEMGSAVWYVKVNVRAALAGLEEPPVMAEFLLQSDGCPEIGRKPYQRYYLRSYTLLDPADVVPEPEPSPIDLLNAT